MGETPETVRLRNGTGPEVTLPEWLDRASPTPEQWLDWMLVQSREAQLVIAEHLLHAEAVLAGAEAIGLARDDIELEEGL